MCMSMSVCVERILICDMDTILYYVYEYECLRREGKIWILTQMRILMHTQICLNMNALCEQANTKEAQIVERARFRH